jgi:hypothetical protein
MEVIDKLVAIEAIRKTKATYWYAIDTKDWDLLSTVFHDGAVVDFRGERDLKPGESIDRLVPAEQALAAGDGAVIKGRDNIVAWLRTVATPLRTVHHGHAPIIEVTGPDEAKAVWPLFDYVDNGQTVMKAYGHYHETYRKTPDGHWAIRTLVLTRLRLDGHHPADFAAR